MNRPVTRRSFVLRTTAVAGAVGVSPFLRAESRPEGLAENGVEASIQPVSYENVSITDTFWRPKMEKVATATLQACIVQTEQKTGRIRNFEKCARKQGEKHEGIYYDDSDVYKAIEAIAFSLKNRPDPVLEKKADEWIDKIAAAQLLDGYLNTYFTLGGLEGRWTDMEKHEDYCAGHLIEAGIAYYRTTGKRKLLDVAIRFADHIDTALRQRKRHWVSGHEEIELALMKLYHLTNSERYLTLAVWFLDQRGHGYGKGGLWSEGQDPAYCQDTVPVKDQRQIMGHAVRAMYLYTGAADVAAVTHDAGYMRAMRSVWEDVVHRNMYFTGGIGSSGNNEGFSQDYDLPNAEAYCETCASVGMVFWNQRMNLMTGDGQYADVMERSLYNGALDGLSLSGDRFFYGNPLASTGEKSHRGTVGRSEWFGTACCPSNIARLVASVGGYLYGTSSSGIWVNLFVSSKTRVKIGQRGVALRVDADYPWSGNIKVSLDPEQPTRFALNLRVPGWARGVAVPGDLYRFVGAAAVPVSLMLNGMPLRYRLEKGYAVIEREWLKGDVVELRLPMPVRQAVTRNEVAANRRRFALQRGPLVYCVEGADNGGTVWNFIASPDGKFVDKPSRVIDERIVAIQGQATGVVPTADGKGIELFARSVTAIPYYTWANRDNYQMQVWLPMKLDDVKLYSERPLTS